MAKMDAGTNSVFLRQLTILGGDQEKKALPFSKCVWQITEPVGKT